MRPKIAVDVRENFEHTRVNMAKQARPADLVRWYMKDHELTQTDFAKQCDITAQLLNMILAGTRDVSPIVALKIQHGTSGVLKAESLCPELDGLLPPSRTGTNG